MVGVAGKSKACNDCKRRRVKCGLERPGCTRCARARIQCSGYSQETIFLNTTLANPTVSTQSVLSAEAKRRTQPQTIQYELSLLIKLSNESAESPSNFRSVAFRLLGKLYLPVPKATESHLGHATPLSWFRAICELDQPCPVLDHALIAFCTAQVHVTETGNVSRDDAIDEYHKTLSLLSTALTGHIRPGYMLATIIALSACEFFVCSTDDGLQVHTQGIASILRLKSDLRELSTPKCASLLSRLRVISMLSQLTCRRPVSITAAQWTELMHGQAVLDLLDQLTEIAYELPETLRMARQAVEGGDACRPELERAITMLWSMLQRILEWHAGLCITQHDPLYTTTISKLRNPSDDGHAEKLFPFAFEFSSLQDAVHFVMSWSLQLHIWTVLLILLEGPGAAINVHQLVSSPPASIYDIHSEAHKLARYLCQSVEYCHRVEMGTFGLQSMIYPQWTVRNFYASCGAKRELQWCESVVKMSGPETRCGIELMTYQGNVF